MAKSTKRYQCPYPDCDYITKWKGNLPVHIRRKHTGEKPFTCEYPNCDYAAASSSELTDQIRRHHTGEKPYECPRCDYAAASASELTRHLNSNACEFSHREAYLWQKLCRKMTVFLRPDCESLPPTIMTPGIDGKEYIVPDNPLRHPDGIIEFIEAKRTPSAIREKDTDVYPLKADKVTFWCLFGNPGRFEDNLTLSIENSDHLIRQLEAQKTSENEGEIDQLILQIALLQKGIDFTKQRSLMPFFEDFEEDS
ncbi:MAG: C2H2-type zinc finger protein [Candidatus Hermodarchaeota archaeon]